MAPLLTEAIRGVVWKPIRKVGCHLREPTMEGIPIFYHVDPTLAHVDAVQQEIVRKDETPEVPQG